VVALVPVAVDASPAVNEFEKLNALFAVVVTSGIFQSVTAPLAMVLKPPANVPVSYSSTSDGFKTTC